MGFDCGFLRGSLGVLDEAHFEHSRASTMSSCVRSYPVLLMHTSHAVVELQEAKGFEVIESSFWMRILGLQ